MSTNNGADVLWKIDRLAHFDPMDYPKPGQSAMINGMEFQVRYIIVNRKCYDSLPTPTAQYKVNGKRVSRKKAYELAAQA